MKKLDINEVTKRAKAGSPAGMTFKDVRKNGRYWESLFECQSCLEIKWLNIYNLPNTKGCSCSKNRKYFAPKDWVNSLSDRHAAMVQRCDKWTHKHSYNYRGRGILNKFESSEQYIKWALGKWPHGEFMGMDIDRIDNDGRYEPTNLKLSTRKVNLANSPFYKMYRGKNFKGHETINSVIVGEQ